MQDRLAYVPLAVFGTKSRLTVTKIGPEMTNIVSLHANCARLSTYEFLFEDVENNYVQPLSLGGSYD